MTTSREKPEGRRVECGCKQARHDHGTSIMYVVDRCRCAECRAAQAAAANKRNRMKAYGRDTSGGRVSSEPARAHISALMQEGVGLKRIAALSGVPISSIGRIMYGRQERGEGPQKRIHGTTEAKILSVRPEPAALADGALLDPTGTRRRVQALAAIGYSIQHIGRLAEVSSATMHQITAGDRQVTAATARRITEEYERLSMTPYSPTGWHQKAAAARARNLARARGWAPPLAWDENIDDPSAVPEGTGPERRMTEAELADEIAALKFQGLSPDLVLQALGRTRESVARQLARAGDHELASWITNRGRAQAA